jgi:ribosomal protein L14E/L6E/L27E
MVPPNSCALMVTAAAPAQTITNTAANTRDAESPGAVILKIIDNNKQTNNGPHKSPEVEERTQNERKKEETANNIKLRLQN